MIKNKKTTSRFMSVVSAVIAVVMLSATIFASGMLSDLTTDDYTVEITRNGEKIELTNRPFIENGVVYVPLRELIEKSISKDDGITDIKWNDGTIDVTIAYYQGESGMYRLKIGGSQLGLKHISFDEHARNFDEIKNNVGVSLGLKQTPVLKESTTYIPVRDASYMLYSFTNRRDENNELYELTYSIFDKNGKDITVPSDEELSEMTNPFRTAELFFAAFSKQDFEKMKRYCTQSCIDGFFGDGYVFGMKRATPLSIGTVDNLAEKGFTDGEWVALANVTMTPGENSVFDPNQTETSFYMILKQQNGIYLIDEFATGL